MREILFRGQTRRYGEKVRIGDGEKLPGRWVYGGVTQGVGCFSIIYGGENQEDPSENLAKWTVYTDTLGQYTGLTDKNGNRIFEGDVVKQTFVKTVPAIHDEIGWDDFDDLYGEDVGAVVIIPSKGACIKNPVIHREVNGEVTEHGETARMYKNVCTARCEVIGNIHDNPELLEGGRDE